jgi:hypothetical protein
MVSIFLRLVTRAVIDARGGGSGGEGGERRRQRGERRRQQGERRLQQEAVLMFSTVRSGPVESDPII